MKRANFTAYNQSYQGFALIENISDLIDFIHEKTNGLIKESARNLVDIHQSKTKHPLNIITVATQKINKIEPKGIVFTQAEIMGGYLTNLHDTIKKGNKIAINPFNMVSYFTIPLNTEIEIISEKENYTEDDIKLLRWEGGSHWYAKISSIDVVINNKQKWNSKIVAHKKAKEFLKQL